jgi:hypothetical protein
LAVKIYTKRPKDISKAVRLLRQQGVSCAGLPIQKADGGMIFSEDDFTITVAQLLDLLDTTLSDSTDARDRGYFCFPICSL